MPQLALDPLPPLLKTRLTRSGLLWETLPRYLQLALVFDTGYVFNAESRPIPFYTKCNSSSRVLQLSDDVTEAACGSKMITCCQGRRLDECAIDRLKQKLNCAVVADSAEFEPGPVYLEAKSWHLTSLPLAVRHKVGNRDLIVITFQRNQIDANCDKGFTSAPIFPCLEYNPDDTTWCPPVQDRSLDAFALEIVRKSQLKQVRRLRNEIPSNATVSKIATGVGILACIAIIGLCANDSEVDDNAQDTLLDHKAITLEEKDEFLEQLQKIGIKVFTATDLELVHQEDSSEEAVAILAGEQVKLTQLDLKSLHDLSDELALQKELSHPNIVQLRGIVCLPKLGLWCVSEYMAFESLRSVLDDDTASFYWSDKKSSIAVDCVAGLKYLHSFAQPIIHGAFTSVNIFIDSAFHAKVSGIKPKRVSIPEMVATTSCLWSAPEILRGDAYTEKADIYSLGIILFELDTREWPYMHEVNEAGEMLSDREIVRLVVKEGLRPTISERCPPYLRNLYRNCVKEDPNERPSAAEVERALEEFVLSLETVKSTKSNRRIRNQQL